MNTFEQKTARNARVQRRYDELMREGRHGHYETMFRVVREEVEAALAAEPPEPAKTDAMLIDRNVVQAALEALESCVGSRYGRDWNWPESAFPSAMAHATEARDSLRAAIERAIREKS